MSNIIYFIFCAAYLLLIPWTPSVTAAVVKVVPILILLARAAWRAPKSRRVWLALGLVFSLGGDLVLALSPRDLFLGGVAAFLVAHVFYIITFRRDMRYSRRSTTLAVLVLMWCLAVGLVVVPHLGGLKAPVIAYIVVIAAMGISAAFATDRGLALFAGASAFIVSDSLLAVDRFVTTLPGAAYLVMATYYFGQSYIVDGVIRRSGDVAPDGSCAEAG